jgi:lysyl-tRNA synthetase class 2
MNPSASFAALEQRAELLRRLREFFHKRGFLEVETPLVADEVIPELHIDPLRLGDCPLFLSARDKPSDDQIQEKGTVPLASWWLQASPELHMKRLLAAGAKAIFQVTHSFRAGERGKLHNPEFTIVEWYRVGDDMQTGINLVDELMQSLLGTPPASRTSYAEAFEMHAGVNPHTASLEELASQLEAPAGMNRGDRDEWLNLILATRVEPQLGRDRPEIIYHYPATQASLAKTVTNAAGYEVAERFELYYRGIELANGYHELSDATEQRRRFEAVNAARVADGRPALPLPESLLAALEHGLPDCTGCALGFDRLAMLAAGAASIEEVVAFPDSRAMIQ